MPVADTQCSFFYYTQHTQASWRHFRKLLTEHSGSAKNTKSVFNVSFQSQRRRMRTQQHHYNVQLNIHMPMYAQGLPTVNPVSSSEPGDSFRVGGDAALGHWWGGNGFLFRICQRREETSLGQDFHSIRECAHCRTAVWHFEGFLWLEFAVLE